VHLRRSGRRNTDVMTLESDLGSSRSFCHEVFLFRGSIDLLSWRWRDDGEIALELFLGKFFRIFIYRAPSDQFGLLLSSVSRRDRREFR
jgi:hypothetical protein